jgi:hypothetical protein
MVTTKINNGDSLTYAFTLTGVLATDILHLEFAIGNLSFTLANGKLVQSNTNPLLFYVYLLSKDTFCLNGNYPVSVAVHTEDLGVVKKNLLANLSVVKTNTKMNLPVETPVISATFDLTVDTTGIIVDAYLQQIAKGEKGDTGEQGEDGLSAYEVAVANGFVGTEAQWLDSLKAKTFIRRHDFVTNVSYCGFAVQGSLENQSVWNISKIVVAVPGTTTTSTASNVKWTDRLTVIYS